MDAKAYAQELRRYARLKRLAAAASAKVEEQRKMLAADCQHPTEFVQDYEWEHDNGYGQQTMHTGLSCTICRKVNRWKQGLWHRI